MKNFSITTKKGDTGSTGLLDSTRVNKYDLRPEAYGSLDEASAFLGLVRAHSDLEEIKELVWTIQNHIYLINSELACPQESLNLLKNKLEKKHVQILESKSNDIEQKLNLLKKFVIYGQTQTSAYLDIARAVIRRAERRVTELYNSEPQDNNIIMAYLNRLSDTLFLLARYDEFSHDIPYAHPSVD